MADHLDKARTLAHGADAYAGGLSDAESISLGILHALIAIAERMPEPRPGLRLVPASGYCLADITHRDEEHRQSVCILPREHTGPHDDEPAPGECTGASDCTVPVHVHGCYADMGGCDSPEEHDAAEGLGARA